MITLGLLETDNANVARIFLISNSKSRAHTYNRAYNCHTPSLEPLAHDYWSHTPPLESLAHDYWSHTPPLKP